MASPQDIALALFERPCEPIFVPKGEKGILLDVPVNYIADRYQPMAPTLSTRFGTSTSVRVPVQPITIPNKAGIDNMSSILPRRANFSPHIPMHREMAGQLIEMLMGMRNQNDFFSACAYCRERLNPSLYIYAFSVSLLHRPDTRNLRLPPLAEVFPDRFIDGGIFNIARERANVLEPDQRVPLEIPQNYTATDLELEHRVAYFREDMGINLHHWHWHLVYPLSGPRETVNKNRRGEIFYYMHQQIIARYDLERMSNALPRVQRLLNYYDPLEEGYFPKLDSLVASRSYAPRNSGAVMRNVDRESDQLKFDIQDLVRWRDRIFDAIHKGRVELPDGTTRPLTIDMLGNMLEASILTPNPLLYGDLHNQLHMAIAFSHDPDQRHLESFGVIGDPSTGMRDPLFYRLHAAINDICVEFKNTQPRYTPADLSFEGIRVTGIELVSPNAERNTINTFWQRSDVDLSRGMDFAPRGAILARFTHLQHMPFQYRITVENRTNAPRMGTVRIFLAPKFDERGQTWQLLDQKNLFIELDRYVVNLKNNPAENVLTRASSESSVTIPFEQTFRDLERNRPTDGPALEQFNFCGCGWPEHMLVPKGHAGGFECQLFVMVSNYEGDRVEQRTMEGTCKDASSYCGIRDGLYPDRRDMGFPFDRLPRAGANTLAQWLTPNMGVTDVTIRFNNRIVTPTDTPRGPQQGQQPPQGGQRPPQGGPQPPQGGQRPPQGGQRPPQGGQRPPQGGQQPPVRG